MGRVYSRLYLEDQSSVFRIPCGSAYLAYFYKKSQERPLVGRKVYLSDFFRKAACFLTGHKLTVGIWRSMDPDWEYMGNYEYHQGCKRCMYFEIERPPELKMIDETPRNELPLLVGHVRAAGYLAKKFKEGETV